MSTRAYFHTKSPNNIAIDTRFASMFLGLGANFGHAPMRWIDAWESAVFHMREFSIEKPRRSC